jgi:hypothetical protein
MKKLICIALITFAVLCAQEKKAEETKAPERRITKVIAVKHANLKQLEPIINVFGTANRFSPELGVIAVSGRLEDVAAVEEAIKRLDVPPATPKNIEFTAYVLAASTQANQGGELPRELESVAKQLKNIFSYQSFRLLDTMVLRVRNGQDGQATGLFQPPTGSPEGAPGIFYMANFRQASLSEGSMGNVIQVRELRFNARVPVRTGSASFQVQDVGFNTGIDIREGQKVVVGKTNLDGSNSAMILVVTARVVE